MKNCNNRSSSKLDHRQKSGNFKCASIRIYFVVICVVLVLGLEMLMKEHEIIGKYKQKDFENQKRKG